MDLGLDDRNIPQQSNLWQTTSLLKSTLVRSQGPLPPANLTPSTRRSNEVSSLRLHQEDNEDDDRMGGNDDSADDEGKLSDISEGGELWLLLQSQ